MAERLHLSSKHREMIEVLLRHHLPGVEAWVYGSRIHGRSHGGSDLDLVLRAPGLQRIDTNRLKALSRASGVKYPLFGGSARLDVPPRELSQRNRERPFGAHVWAIT